MLVLIGALIIVVGALAVAAIEELVVACAGVEVDPPGAAVGACATPASGASEESVAAAASRPNQPTVMLCGICALSRDRPMARGRRIVHYGRAWAS